MPLPENERFALRPGPVWDSVEDLLRSEEAALEEVASGAVATLGPRVGRFRLLSEDDFQALYGMALEARRVAAELNSVLSNAGERPDEDTAQRIMARVVELAGSLGALPARPGREKVWIELEPHLHSSRLQALRSSRTRLRQPFT